MATRYWVGNGGNWDDTTHWSATSGGAGGASMPAVDDDVFFDINSFSSGSQTVQIGSSTRYAHNLTFSGVTNTPRVSSSLGVGLGISGSLTLVSGMVLSNVQLDFMGTTGSHTITTAGKKPTIFKISGVGGTWTLQDALTCSSQIRLTGGNFNTNGYAVQASSIDLSGTFARTITLGASAVLATSGAQFQNGETDSTQLVAWDTTNSTNLSIDAGTSTITFGSTGSSFDFVFMGGGFTYYNVVAVSGANRIRGANTYNNLTVNSGATHRLRIQGEVTQTVTGTFTCNGASATVRPVIMSDTLGTPAIISAGTVSISNCDFRDITGAGVGSWTGASIGDRLGNSGITMTASTNRYWVGGTGSWSNTARWSTSSGGASGASVPLPQDDVFINGSSGTGTITIDILTACTDLDCTGAGAITLSFTGSIFDIYRRAMEFQGDFLISASMTLGNQTTYVAFTSRSTSRTITMNGVAFQNSLLYFEGHGGGWVFQDSFSQTGVTNRIRLTAGHLNTNGKAFSVGLFEMIGSYTRTLTLGASTVTMLYSSWTVSGSNYSVNAGTSHITSPNNTMFFTGGGCTYYDVTFTVSSFNDGVFFGNYIDDLNTFHNINVDMAAGLYAVGELGLFEDQVVTNQFSATGVSMSKVVLVSSVYWGTRAKITAASVSLSDVYFKDIEGAGAASWSGTRLGDMQGNTGITFATPRTLYWRGNGGQWQDTSHWSTTSGGSGGQNVPRPQDTVIFDTNSISSGSQTIEVGGPSIGKDVSFAAVTNSPKVQFSYTGYDYVIVFGSLTMGSGMTMDEGMNSSVLFWGRGNETFTSNGVIFDGGIRLYMYGGTLTVTDDFEGQHFYSDLLVYLGTLTFDNVDVIASGIGATLLVPEINTGNRTINLGNGTFTLYLLNETEGIAMNTCISVSYDGSVINGESATIVVANDPGTYIRGISMASDGSAGQLGNVTATTNVDSTSFSFSMLCNNLTVTSTANDAEVSGGDCVVIETLTMSGTSGKKLYVYNNFSAAIAVCDYLNVDSSIASGIGTPFYAGAHSTDLGNNTNWCFTTACMLSLPEYNTSLVSAVARVQQNLPTQQFIIGGSGGTSGTTYALFKKSSTYTFNIWRSGVYKIGRDFDVVGVIFNISSDIIENLQVVPVLYFDDGARTVFGTTVNSINYTNGRLVELSSKNFDNNVHGKYNFFFELRMTGSALATVALPIFIDVDIKDS